MKNTLTHAQRFCSVKERTKALLESSDRIELALYNQEGYFHRVSERKHFEQMRAEWEAEGRASPDWISRGMTGGIWAAMFDRAGTYRLIAEMPILITRFHFRGGYSLYDTLNPRHHALWKGWNGNNKPNPWDNLHGAHGLKLSERIRMCGSPTHKLFYEEQKLGAIIGYFDYASVVIVLEDAIANIEFSEIADPREI